MDEARIPPHDLDAEAAVLSAVMLDSAAMDRAAAMLTPDRFYSEAHRRIFEACLSLQADSKPVDLLQVAGRLRDNGRLTQVGGSAYVTEVLGSMSVTSNVESYCTRVSHKHQLRQLILACQRIVAQGYADVEDVSAFVDGAEQSVYDVARQSTDRPRLEPLKDSVISEFARWQAADGAPKITGVPTGLEALDNLLAGLHDGELTIVAGRPGQGKTALAVDIAWFVAAVRDEMGERPYGAALFSLEMPKEQIADRAICSEAGVDLGKARRGTFTPADWSKMATATNELTKLDQFLVNDTPALSLAAIRAMVREAASDLARRHKRLRLVVVDYLQLMSAEGRHESREQAVASVSRGLKRLAKEMRLPVIAAAQLNRSVEQRTDKRPNLSDLRESGAIEQDADNVVMIYREAYYNDEAEDKKLTELIVAKQRNGPTGTAYVGFDASFTKFYNLPPEYENETARED